VYAVALRRNPNQQLAGGRVPVSLMNGRGVFTRPLDCDMEYDVMNVRPAREKAATGSNHIPVD